MKIKNKKQPLKLDKPKRTRKPKTELPHFSPSLQKFISKSVDYIILDDSIKLKSKQIISTTGFSSRPNRIPIMGLPIDLNHMKYAFGPLKLDDVEVVINVKPKKFNRLLELFKQQKRISFEMTAQSVKIISTGFIKEVNYSEYSMGFTYSPNEFSIL